MSAPRGVVLFDAAGTLYEPSSPVEPLYRSMQQRGMDVQLDDLPRLLRRAHRWWADPARPLSRTDDEETAERRQYVRMVLEDYGAADEQLVEAIAEEVYWARWARVYDDVGPALEALRGRWQLAVLSNGGPSSLDALRFAGLADSFDRMFAGLEIGALKPERAAYQAAVRGVDAAPEDAWLVDDTPANVAGALAAGLRGVLLDRSQQYAGWSGIRLASLTELPGVLATEGETANGPD